jgi:ketosteroid isomerase-like protein
MNYFNSRREVDRHDTGTHAERGEAPDEGHTMTTHAASPEAVVAELVGALAALDVEALQRLVDADVRVTEPASLPYGGVYQGHAGFFEDLLPKIAGNFAIGVEEPRVFAGDGAAVAAMTIVYTAHTTGESYRTRYVEIYTVEAGLITAIDVFPQDAGALGDWMRTAAPAAWAG